MKKIGILLLAITIIILVIVKFSSDNVKQNKEKREKTVPVSVGYARVGRLEDIKKFSGIVTAKNSYNAAFNISGKIEAMYKNIGDFVNKGEILAVLDDREFEQKLLEAKADLEISRANLADSEYQLYLNKQEFERVKSLKEKGFSSVNEYDRAEKDFKSAENRLNISKSQLIQKEASISSAVLDLENCKIRAFHKGFVLQKFTEQGNSISSNSSVYTIADIDTVTLKTEITEDIFPKLEKGQNVKFTVDSYPDKIFNGKVKRFSPSFSNETISSQVEIESENSNHILKPGMFAKIDIIFETKENAIMIPSYALYTAGGVEGVFSVDSLSGLVKFIQIKKGIRENDMIEVLEPNLSGMVVTLGQHLLKDGSLVSIEK